MKGERLTNMYLPPEEGKPRPLELTDTDVRYKIVSVSKVYADCGKQRFKGLYDFENVEFQFGEIEQYIITGFIGSGRFSAAFSGVCRKTRQRVAIKTFRPVSVDYLKRELFFLKQVKGCPNVIQFIDLVRDPMSGAISHVCEFVKTSRHRNLYPTLTLDEVRYYVFQLLRTLNECHSRGIMHRDVKPDNLLIEHKERKIRLIDWGLAEVYFPKQQYPPYVGTLRYRAPELLLGYRYYDYSVDIWAAGVTLGEMLVRFPLFNAEFADEMIREISDLCTGSAILVYADKMGVDVCDAFLRAMPEFSFDGWHGLKEKARPEMCDPDAFDLLKRMLVVDHANRITAKEALAHPFFDPLRGTEDF